MPIPAKITKGQITSISIAVNGKMDRETYENMLAGYGVKSKTKLTYWQAAEILTKLGVKPKFYGAGKRGQQKHLTPGQGERIKILSEIMEWETADILRFIKRQVGVNKGVEMLMNYEAVKVITGLTRILAKGDKEGYTIINTAQNSQLKELFRSTKSERTKQNCNK